MTEIRFTWDENKNISNQRKHDGIAFKVATQVFRDPLRPACQDRIEGYEMRWQTIGSVYGVTVLLVAHTITEEDSDRTLIKTIRIISARRAIISERKRYEEENG